jgi:hypothetical protein
MHGVEIAMQQESMHIEPIFILETLNRENQHLHRYLLTLAKTGQAKANNHLRLLEASYNGVSQAIK